MKLFHTKNGTTRIKTMSYISPHFTVICYKLLETMRKIHLWANWHFVMKHTIFINIAISADSQQRQPLLKNSSVNTSIARQWLSHAYTTTEELLDVVFPTRSTAMATSHHNEVTARRGVFCGVHPKAIFAELKPVAEFGGRQSKTVPSAEVLGPG